MTSEADRFTTAYAAMRAHEPWAENDRLRRAGAITSAVQLMRAELGPGAVIVDVGAGMMRVPGVISVDIGSGADIRGDMRALPLRDASVDGLLYAASLHYARIEDAIGEAARVLRRGGILVALDSPIYKGRNATAAAATRSAAYYARAGHPELANHYHPIEAGRLRAALAETGFELLRLSTGSRWSLPFRRRGPNSFVLARSLR